MSAAAGVSHRPWFRNFASRSQRKGFFRDALELRTGWVRFLPIGANRECAARFALPSHSCHVRVAPSFGLRESGPNERCGNFRRPARWQGIVVLCLRWPGAALFDHYSSTVPDRGSGGTICAAGICDNYAVAPPIRGPHSSGPGGRLWPDNNIPTDTEAFQRALAASKTSSARPKDLRNTRNHKCGQVEYDARPRGAFQAGGTPSTEALIFSASLGNNKPT